MAAQKFTPGHIDKLKQELYRQGVSQRDRQKAADLIFGHMEEEDMYQGVDSKAWEERVKKLREDRFKHNVSEELIDSIDEHVRRHL